jgi:hypothetical protein
MVWDEWRRLPSDARVQADGGDAKLVQNSGGHDTIPRRGEEIRRVGGFAAGGRVYHQTFGYGTVVGVDDNKLTIHFDVAGDKKVMDAYVKHVVTNAGSAYG